MTARLFLPALFCAATLPLLAQEPRLVEPRLNVPGTPHEAQTDAPDPDFKSPLTHEELLKQIESVGSDTSLTTIPKAPGVKKNPNGSDSSNGTTEITANEGAFDQKGHVAVFLKDVFVENPDFTVKCDKMTAFLHHEDKEKDPVTGDTKPKAAPAPAATPTPKKRVSNASSGNATQAERAAAVAPGVKPAPKSGGGLEKAICEGAVLITQDKIDVEGNLTHNIGHSKVAVYEAATGDITLTGNPDVQQGINTCLSLSESTKIVLNRNGQMKVYGPHKTIIRDGGASSTTTSSTGSGSSSGPVATAR